MSNRFTSYARRAVTPPPETPDEWGAPAFDFSPDPPDASFSIYVPVAVWPFLAVALQVQAYHEGVEVLNHTFGQDEGQDTGITVEVGDTYSLTVHARWLLADGRPLSRDTVMNFTSPER